MIPNGLLSCNQALFTTASKAQLFNWARLALHMWPGFRQCGAKLLAPAIELLYQRVATALLAAALLIGSACLSLATADP